MHRGAKERPQLRFEELRLVETHADSAPAKKGIRLGWEPAHGQLVATDVEGANHYGHPGKRLDDATVGAILLILVRHARPPNHQEFRSHQADTLGAAACRRFGLLRNIHVR